MRIVPTAQRQVMAVAFPVTEDARSQLAAALGDGWQVLDIRCAPSNARAVVLHVCSPQTLRRVRAEFPLARLLLLETASRWRTDSDLIGASVASALAGGRQPSRRAA